MLLPLGHRGLQEKHCPQNQILSDLSNSMRESSSSRWQMFITSLGE
ncbi:hypothetical protein PL9214640035 [Planktothrix tepida PCC 9214]|uniref:Uncharacterized protein n=1 Tax=Planktothrix tepida PCC 9214 TaxID=671072 RepID=A0A1J1LQ36_9CYAN|nr:hypothetical protein PL9214640035 [Planktothrix tepida PCC 9214]